MHTLALLPSPWQGPGSPQWKRQLGTPAAAQPPLCWGRPREVHGISGFPSVAFGHTLNCHVPFFFRPQERWWAQGRNHASSHIPYPGQVLSSECCELCPVGISAFHRLSWRREHMKAQQKATRRAYKDECTTGQRALGSQRTEMCFKLEKQEVVLYQARLQNSDQNEWVECEWTGQNCLGKSERRARAASKAQSPFKTWRPEANLCRN